MLVRMHLCIPEGTSLNETFSEIMEITKRDNRRLIRAIMNSGVNVPDTVTDLGLSYVPHQHKSVDGEPVFDVYGLQDMLAMNTFSCAEAAAFEAAIMEEKYGLQCRCVSVPQGPDDSHAVFVVGSGVIDPTMNHLRRKKRSFPERRRDEVSPNSCSIVNGSVVCTDPPACSVSKDGTWDCPDVPRLDGGRELVKNTKNVGNGQGWTHNRNGDVLPTRDR